MKLTIKSLLLLPILGSLMTMQASASDIRRPFVTAQDDIKLSEPASAADDNAAQPNTPNPEATNPDTANPDAANPDTSNDLAPTPMAAPEGKVSRTPIARNPDTFTIIPGDVLQVTVWKEEGLDQEVLVLSDGSVNFPLIGSIPAQGKTPAELQAEIKQKLHSLIPSASVTVMVKAALGHTVSVIGQVLKPGELIMGHNLTVMQALSQAGGLTPYGSESEIIILRHIHGKETSIPFPYDDVINGDELDKDIALTPGDVVVVPTAGLF